MKTIRHTIVDGVYTLNSDDTLHIPEDGECIRLTYGDTDTLVCVVTSNEYTGCRGCYFYDPEGCTNGVCECLYNYRFIAVDNIMDDI